MINTSARPPKKTITFCWSLKNVGKSGFSSGWGYWHYTWGRTKQTISRVSSINGDVIFVDVNIYGEGFDRFFIWWNCYNIIMRICMHHYYMGRISTSSLILCKSTTKCNLLYKAPFDDSGIVNYLAVFLISILPPLPVWYLRKETSSRPSCFIMPTPMVSPSL